MKRRDYFLILIVVLILLVATIWALQTPKKIARLVTLTIVTNSPTGEVGFRLKNSGRLSIFLSKVFVDVKTPNGWWMRDEIVPSDPRNIDAGGAKDLLVSVPGGSDLWRLRVAYGDELRGPELLLMKIDFAIHYHKIPHNGFGAFAGSNSVSSAEISK